MDKNSLYQLVRINLSKNFDISVVFIDSVLDVFDDIVTWEENLIWLTKWKILNPSTIKDRAVYVLKKEWIPMHFVDIANKISEMTKSTIKVNTVHNELIKNSDFILVWRWVYGLKEHWYKWGTILDVIVEVLKKHWKPMTSEDITNEVLKYKKVQVTTIYMNIQNKNYIERVWRNFYQLKQ